MKRRCHDLSGLLKRDDARGLGGGVFMVSVAPQPLTAHAPAVSARLPALRAVGGQSDGPAVRARLLIEEGLLTGNEELGPIYNTSARRDLVVSLIHLTGDFFSTPGLALPLVIGPGQFATVTVRFAPTRYVFLRPSRPLRNPEDERVRFDDFVVHVQIQE